MCSTLSHMNVLKERNGEDERGKIRITNVKANSHTQTRIISNHTCVCVCYVCACIGVSTYTYQLLFDGENLPVNNVISKA